MSKQKLPMTVFDLQDPAKDRSYPKLEQAQATLSHFAARQPVFARVPAYKYAYLTDAPVEIDIYRTQDRLQQLLTTSDTVQGVLPGNDPDPNAPQLLQTAVVKFPKGYKVLFTVVSPQQKYICYHLKSAKLSSPLAWLH